MMRAGIEDVLPLLGRSVVVLHAPYLEGEAGGGRDIDCAVHDLDPLWPLRLTSPWRLCQVLQYDVRSWFWILERDGEVVALDTSDDPAGLGKYGFPTRLVAEAGVRSADGARAAYLLAKRLRKGSLDHDEWSRIARVDAGNRAAFERSMAELFGRGAARRLAQAASSGSLPDTASLRAASRAHFRSRFRTPWRVVTYSVLQARRWTGRALRPSGLVVLVVGPDGSGKSSLADALGPACTGLFRRVVRSHWRPGLLPRPGAISGAEAADPSAPHARQARGKVPSIALALYYWIDFAVGGALRLWTAKARTGLVIVERGWWDMLVDPARYRSGAPGGLLRFLGRIQMQPDLVLVLQAPAEVFLARKQELSREELDRQTAQWGSVLPRDLRAVFLDAARPSSQVLAAAREEIVRVLEERAIARLGPGWAGFPRPGAIRWWATRGPRRAARSSLRVYQPVTGKGRAGWRIAGALASLGGFRVATRAVAPPKALREILAGHVPAGGSYAVMRANHPHRYIALVLDRDGRPAAVVKFAGDADGSRALAREANALRDIGPRLEQPLRAPELIQAQAGSLVMTAVEWKVRTRPWRLPVEVARSLGALYASGRSSDDELGVAHGDCAPWNLLETTEGWTLVDWEEAGPRRPAFFDPFHFLVQGNALLGQPSVRGLVDGLDGGGWVGAALQAYARAAGLADADLRVALRRYLDESAMNFDQDVPGAQGAAERRARLARAAGV